MTKTYTRAALAAALIAVTAILPAAAEHRNRQNGSYGGAVVFKDPNFRGAALSINGPIENLAYERFNDSISSIQLNGTWEVCVDPNFRGKCTVIDGSVEHLSLYRMNDNITSLRPVNGNARNRDWRRDNDRGRNGDYGRRGSYAISLYRDPSFRGAEVGFDGAIANLNYSRFNDTASSIRVNSGRWIVCEDPNYRGRCEVVDGSVSHLRQLSLNDRITSLRPYDARRDRNIGYGRDRNSGYGDYNRDDDYLYGGRRDTNYGDRNYGRNYQFNDPRDNYGDRIRDRRGNATRFCRDNGYNRADEVETSGRYYSCIICAN